MSGERIRILLVEDDEVDRMGLERLVLAEDLPYDLVNASTASEGIAQFQQNQLDLALIDYRLPDGTGLDVQKHAADVPCIFITGTEDIRVAIQAMKAGAYDFLVKDNQWEWVTLLPTLIQTTLQRKQERDRIERQQRIIDSLGEMVVRLDEKGEIRCVNAAVEQTLGYAPEDMIGSSFRDLAGIEMAQRDDLGVLAVDERRGDLTPTSYDLEMTRRDGSKIWTEWRHSSGKGGEVICVGWDISMRKLAEQELQIAHDGLEVRVGERTADLEAANAALKAEIEERRLAQEEIARRAAQQEAMNAIIAAAAGARDLRDLLETALERTLQACELNQGGIWLKGEGYWTVQGLSKDVPSAIRQALKGTQQKIAGPIVVEDWESEEMLGVLHPLVSRFGIRASITVPIIGEAEAIGGLSLTYPRPRSWPPEEIAFLEAVGRQLGAAAERLHLLDQLRGLANYLQAAREEERTHIAREIHDEFGQVLMAMKMDLAQISKRLPPDDPLLAEKMEDLSRLLASTVQMVRRIATQLRPALLDNVGLAAAMEWQAHEFSERTDIASELHLTEQELALGRDQATAIFRIFQETLTNIARHAQATRVQVDLEGAPDEVVLSVHDDGVGITESQLNDPGSLGLMGMRERARAMAGEVAFEGLPEQGTTVILRIPRSHANVKGA
ncbi:MAG: response regulator [Anaerolineales bacterium]